MKKSSKKGVSSRRNNSRERVTKVIHESSREIKIDKALVDNFIALQKVMVNLSAKFDNLTVQISKLLELFEISAKALARKDFEETGSNSKNMERVMEKLDNLSQQAGLIGKGLVLIHETRGEGNGSGFQERPTQMTMPANPVRQMPPMNKPGFNKPMPSMQGSQKSEQPKPSENSSQ